MLYKNNKEEKTYEKKRYFCDYWFGSGQKVKNPSLMIILPALVIITISSIISYNVFISKYENELNSYSEITYKYLDNIADNVIQEGIGIDLLSLSNDIKYDITNKNNEVIFEYYLDNNKDMLFAPSANMTVKLSNNFTIISKVPNYSSNEDYISNIKVDMKLCSMLIGIFILVSVLILSYIGCTVGAFISKSNKNKRCN